MSHTDQPNAPESRRRGRKRESGSPNGLCDSPTSPRGNQIPDRRRTEMAREDYQRVLGN